MNDMKILVSDVAVRKDFYPRLQHDQALVIQYAEYIELLPPIVLNQHDELIDGLHRLLAHQMAGVAEIAFVRTHTQDNDDALRQATQLNAAHGKQLSIADKRSVAQRLYRPAPDATASDRAKLKQSLADDLSVMLRSVQRWVSDDDNEAREQRIAAALDMLAAGRTQQEVGDLLGVDQSTVSVWTSDMNERQMSFVHTDDDGADDTVRTDIDGDEYVDEPVLNPHLRERVMETIDEVADGMFTDDEKVDISRTVEADLECGDIVIDRPSKVGDVITGYIGAAALSKIQEAKEKEAAEQERKRKEKEAKDQRAAEKREQRAAEIAAADANAPARVPVKLHNLPVAELHAVVPAGSVDVVITDPPYKRKYLSTLTDLAKFADHALKPDGVLVVLYGHSHLLQAMSLLNDACDGIKYRWAFAVTFETGGNVYMMKYGFRTAWKPLLVYQRPKPEPLPNMSHLNDTIESSNAAKQDTRFHEWGQDLPTFEKIVQQFTLPGQVICDPFLGGGTTAVAAINHRNPFIGADALAECVSISAGRLAGEEVKEPYDLEVV